MFITLTVFFIIALVLLVFIVRKTHEYFHFWTDQGVNGLHYLDFGGLIQKHHEYNLEMAQKFGKIYGGFFFAHKFIVINDPDLIREVFMKKFRSIPNHTSHYLGESSNVNNMLFFMPGDDNWKRVRSIISPAFTSGKLKSMMSYISEISDDFIKSLEDFERNGKVIDIRKHVGAFAMDVISACAYGIKIDSIRNPDHPIITNVKKVLNINASFSMVTCILLPKLASWLKLNFFDMSAINFFDKLVKQIKEDRQNIDYNISKVNKKTDFIQIMLDSEVMEDLGSDHNDVSINQKSMGTLSPDELTAQAIVFFVAGYDTTSSAMSHLIYYLAQNEECQQKLYEELKEVKEFSYENLSQFKYLNACIDETLRLAPTVLRIQRQGTNDIEIKGIRIPAGTSVDVLPYALHRDPELWPDPLEFKPERFLTPVHHPWAYLPFGGGPRICLGQRFALNEMRICCAKLFKKFEFTIAPGFEKLEYFTGNVILSPKSLMTKMKARS